MRRRPVNYYNEHDTNAAAWLEELVAGGDLPPASAEFIKAVMEILDETPTRKKST